MNNRWFISDTHFGHANMLKFTKSDGTLMRPGFDNVNHMNEFIIEKWNSIVNNNDTVMHLGDVGMRCSNRTLEDILKRLNGNKYLVMGNHDRENVSFYGRNFKKVRGWFHFTESGAAMICTHCPLHESSFLHRYNGACINVHGHIHARTIPDPHYVNISVEQIDYTPVSYDWLMEKARKFRKSEVNS